MQKLTFLRPSRHHWQLQGTASPVALQQVGNSKEWIRRQRPLWSCVPDAPRLKGIDNAYPPRLTLKMMVWKMFLLFRDCILRFHVNLPGCIVYRSAPQTYMFRGFKGFWEIKTFMFHGFGASWYIYIYSFIDVSMHTTSCYICQWLFQVEQHQKSGETNITSIFNITIIVHHELQYIAIRFEPYMSLKIGKSHFKSRCILSAISKNTVDFNPSSVVLLFCSIGLCEMSDYSNCAK